MLSLAVMSSIVSELVLGKPLAARNLSFPIRRVPLDDISVPFQRNTSVSGRRVGYWPEPGHVSSSDTCVWMDSSALIDCGCPGRGCG